MKHDKHSSANKQPNGSSDGRGRTLSPRQRRGYRAGQKTTASASSTDYRYCALVVSLALLVAILERKHLVNMFESERHFSHLSNLEREMTFRTEMGLYYSYYKTIIEASTFTSGLSEIMSDNVTEYPLVINTLKRFNLYPEVALGAAFRVFNSVAESLHIQTKICYNINRGEGHSSVDSCVGLGDPSTFYIEAVFSLNGLSMAVFFLFGTYLSGGVLGGLLTVLFWFYNHGESTRVQWTPPLRESFAFVFIFAEIFAITRVLRLRRPSSFLYTSLIAALTVISMLSWQFAQFAFTTMLLAVFATYVLGYIGSYKMKIIIFGQAIGLVISFTLLFGNTMLLSSFFSTGLVTIYVIVQLERQIEKIRVHFVIWLVQAAIFICGTLSLKLVISKVLNTSDDAHIFDIMKSKFTGYQNFDSMLYTCAPEFSFMQFETLVVCTKTLVLPIAIGVVGLIVHQTVWRDLSFWVSHPADTPQPKVSDGSALPSKPHSQSSTDATEEEMSTMHRHKPHAELLYHIVQLAAFSVMAGLIMRLKLFWTPHLSLLSSLLTSSQWVGWLGPRSRQLALVAAVVAVASVQGIMNVNKQLSITGEFSNYPQEELIDWINTNTERNAVFAGAIPMMATVKLCTKRPIVDHPHYEDVGLRERVKKVYTMFSRKPISEPWRHLVDLQVDYLIITVAWCHGRSSLGCGMVDIWDAIDPENRSKEKTCDLLMNKDLHPYFTRVFRNKSYDILRVLHPAKKT